MAKTRGHQLKLTPDRWKTWLLRSAFPWYAGILAIALATFWPVSTGSFAVKNDDIIYFLPYRYSIVENLQNGYFPYWSPFIYMGLPIAGDMQSGAWNPVVWLMSLAGRYTLNSLHFELLFYVFLAGAGMFAFIRSFQVTHLVAFTIAVSYMLCGYIVDSGQILCWVTCAALLPFVYHSFVQLLRNPSLARGAKFSLWNVFMLVAGYPFFFIANLYFFIVATVVYMAIKYRTQRNHERTKLSGSLLFSGLLFALISAAPLLSFYEMLPFYARGSYLPLDSALYNSFSLFSTVSTLLPFAITKTGDLFGNNNEIGRNLYLGIVLLPFCFSALTYNPKGWKKITAFFILLAYLFSLGESLPFRSWAYHYLPFFDKFRHPANFRVFVIMGILVLAAKGLDDAMKAGYSIRKKMATAMLTLGAIIFVICAFFPVQFSSLKLSALTAQGIKAAFAGIGLSEVIWISALTQLPFLICGYFLAKKGLWNWLCFVSIVNMIVMSQPQIFYSVVSKTSPSTLNKFIQSQPVGFPEPDVIAPVSTLDTAYTFPYRKDFSVGYSFLKKVTINTSINNPTILTGYRKFLHDSLLVATTQKYPFIYLSDSVDRKGNWLIKKQSTGKQNIQVLSFKPDKIVVKSKSAMPARLVLLQNIYPGWSASIGGKPVNIENINGGFMGLMTMPGGSIVEFYFQPSWFWPGILLSITGIFLSTIIVLKPFFGYKS